MTKRNTAMATPHRVEFGDGVKIYYWGESIEDGALHQANNVATHPCLVGNVCLMPDTHEGFGMPIGCVAALENAVSPNMVGVDIGCGMRVAKTSIKNISIESLKQILGKIRQQIPTGLAHHKEAVNDAIFDSNFWNFTDICKKERDYARHQIGTLGGGNHFIEIQKSDSGEIYFMIHSGSRNLGYKVANHYNSVANDLCLGWHWDNVVKNELAFLPKASPYHDAYLDEMHICLDFAYRNRWKMSEIIKSIFQEVLDTEISFEETDVHHNYASLEEHFGKLVWVHRKGAISAKEGQIGIIPGSQGSSSYIVKGLGNESSMMSCSHGAGRVMSRTRATKELSLENEINALNKKGILHAIRSKRDLEEAPSAYKNIDVVMQDQADLCEIVTKLQPLAVIKG